MCSDGVTKDYFEYRIIEFKDENGNVKVWLCQVKKNGENHGDVFEAQTHEQVFAWLRLMIGAYPGTSFDNDISHGIAS